MSEELERITFNKLLSVWGNNNVQFSQGAD